MNSASLEKTERLQSEILDNEVFPTNASAKAIAPSSPKYTPEISNSRRQHCSDLKKVAKDRNPIAVIDRLFARESTSSLVQLTSPATKNSNPASSILFDDRSSIFISGAC